MSRRIAFWVLDGVGFQRSNSENEDWNPWTLSMQIKMGMCFKGQTQKMRIEIEYRERYRKRYREFQRSNSENEDWNARQVGIKKHTPQVSKVKLRKWGLKLEGLKYCHYSGSLFCENSFKGQTQKMRIEILSIQWKYLNINFSHIHLSIRLEYSILLHR